jgi:hypothetical protein
LCGIEEILNREKRLMRGKVGLPKLAPLSLAGNEFDLQIVARGALRMSSLNYKVINPRIKLIGKMKLICRVLSLSSRETTDDPLFHF